MNTVFGSSLVCVTVLSLAVISVAWAGLPTPLPSTELPAQDSPEAAWWRESMQTRDERLAWWRDARFGMFIHWGVYSELGNEYQGKRGGGYAEHIQRVLKIPIPEYRSEIAAKFNPAKFDADAWVRSARDAGMGYFVITAKHHDGFAMWPSKVNAYNLTDATPFKRDPMAELREACKKYGLKFGFYYSHAFDWGEKDGPGNDWDYQNPGGDKLLGGREWWQSSGGSARVDATEADANTVGEKSATTAGRADFLPSAHRYVNEKAIPQLQELIAMYHPDIIWFDTPHKLPPSENYRILKAVRAAGPDVVVNGRLVRGWGDYESTADRPAEFSPHPGDWEGIPTTNESYGWSKFDLSHKSVAHFVQTIAKASARGGNMLVNIGPRGDGTFDPKDAAILRGIGAWWQVNGESIRGTTRTPLPVQAWGESTVRGSQLYLHVFRWPVNGRLVVGGLTSTVKSAELLTNAGRKKLTVARIDRLDVSIELPTVAPNEIDSVILLTCADALQVDHARLLQPAFASEVLRAFDGNPTGDVRFGPGKKTDDYAMNWGRPDGAVTWPVRLKEAATFEVFVNYDAPTSSVGGRFVVSFEGQELRGVVREGVRQTVSLGRVTLAPGKFDIQVVGEEIKGSELFRLRHVELHAVTDKN
ncbi:alpha-L-fucosidase [Oleiharenicola lentus]|uniref:alpha-L-fucosidase n=1 Tax=Oleiharenicola lentus TaxID=2508720 RepID=UPI003F661107